MAARKERDVWQFGDFQTPTELARDVCEILTTLRISPGAVVEPTCGHGTFLKAAAEHFPNARRLLGVEINPLYADEARKSLGSAAEIENADFFAVNWDEMLSKDPGPWLVLGNPPWVTNAELGLLKSTNLPEKSNFQGHKGLDALTGKANFDISEWMLLKQLEWLRARSGWIAMLVKTSVARKILRQVWRRNDPVGRASIYKIDATKHFGASVDACLFVLPVSCGQTSRDCDVYESLKATTPLSTIGFHDQHLVSDVKTYKKNRKLIGHNEHYVWRSGVKHDCSKVMELSREESGLYSNGLGEQVDLEPDLVFPMLKSSDVANGRTRPERFMIVTQREIGQDTAQVEVSSPKTWGYLISHSNKMDVRGSVIYRGKPRFSVFGVGDYTFAPWKVAISGFYKTIKFMKVGPVHGKPVVMDDTIYFLPCQSEAEAEFILSLVQSRPFTEVLRAMTFIDEKRPITAELLKRISLERIADHLNFAGAYAEFTKSMDPPQRRLAIG